MIKSAKSLIGMVPDYDEIKIYSEPFHCYIPVPESLITEILKEQRPAQFFNVDTTSGLLLIGHPDKEGE